MAATLYSPQEERIEKNKGKIVLEGRAKKYMKAFRTPNP